jgi:hypothetical protein
METDTTNARWTRENIIDLIRKIRNDLIKDFLDERYLREYVLCKFNIREIPNVRVEFLRKELKEFLISPVDIQHYHRLIEQIHETDTASLSGGNERLFYEDVERVLRRYVWN